MKNLETYKLRHEGSSFRPCEISEVVEEIRLSVYALRFGACYQVCDKQLNTMMGAGAPAIIKGKYAAGHKIFFAGEVGHALRAKRTGVLTRINDRQKMPYENLQEVLFYALIFPQGLSIENEIQHKSLREILAEDPLRKDAVYLSLKQMVDEDPHNPSWDGTSKHTGIVFSTDQPVLVAIQKDEIVKGEIIRGAPRPWQKEPGVYYSF